jgi:ABC-type protease/lipase transport system fused ATPase/permease subunit
VGRALAPIERIVSQWALFHRAHEGWQHLALLLDEVPADSSRTMLPRPKSQLTVHQISVVPPNGKKPTLRMVSFAAQAGQAVGVIGASGAGKSTLANALTGLWQPVAGDIRLDQAPLDQYDRDDLGRSIGYLPQRVPLFEGTIKENIARLTLEPDDTLVVAAAKSAAAHAMILDLPLGYDTQISAQGGQLSGGQIQRIGLARALYGDPFVVILDEPNAHLDNEGSMALNTAVEALKAAGKIVFIIAHRPSAIEACDMLLVLENGVRRAFGPKDVVLAENVLNHRDVAKAVGKIGGAA